jgi:hypothetical protein
MRSVLLAVPLLCAAAISPLAAQARHPAAKAATGYAWPDQSGPMKWAPRPTVAAITANDLRTRLYQYADDSMMGRKVGELGDYKATAYIASEFKRFGLKPAGDDGGYFQELDFGPLGFDSTTAALSIAGQPLQPRVDWIPVAPTAGNGAAAHADLQDVPVVFAGELNDTTALDPAVYRGKVAVFIAPANPFRFGGRGGTGSEASCPADAGMPNQRGAAYSLALAAGSGGAIRRGRGAGAGGNRRAEQAGVAGVLLIDDSILPAAANLAFGARQGMKPTLPTTGIPTATISRDAVRKLFGKPLNELSPGTAGSNISGSWTYGWHKSATPARNVIGILPGSDPTLAGEYVLLSAHNDHNGINAVGVDHDSLRAWNRVMRPQGANDRPTCPPTALQQHLIDSMIAHARSIRPPRRDSINNGAEDDGSGTVILLEVAEKFASEQPHPRRSLIFVSHTGEEAGLLGSAWFTSHPTIPLDSIVAANNMDMDSRGRTTDVEFGGPHSIQTLGSRRLSRAFGDIIDSVNALSPTPMAIDKTWDVSANPSNRFCRSDQVNYVHHNVPVTYYSTGYYEDYHQVTDEPEYIDYDHGAAVGRFMHDIITALANRNDKPAIDGPDPAYPACR